MATSYPSAQDMPSAATEAKRKQTLRSYRILDTETEAAFDDLAKLAATICGTPSAFISFLDGDRMWLKSSVGFGLTEGPTVGSFCSHTVSGSDHVMIIPDALADERFAESPYVTGDPNLRAYAGASLVTPEGVPLGALCVFDPKARPFTDTQRDALEKLSRQVMSQLELRRRVRKLERGRAVIKASNAQLKQFTYLVSHDLRGPLLNVGMMAKAFSEDFADTLAPQATDYLTRLENAADRAITMLDDLANFLKRGMLDKEAIASISLEQCVAKVFEDLPVPRRTAVEFEFGEVKELRTHPLALHHILLNLVGNALKYTDGPVVVSAHYEKGDVILKVSDEGAGIDPTEYEQVFEPFRRGRHSTRAAGKGLGLALVRQLVNSLGGQVKVGRSTSGGAEFQVLLPQ